MSLYEMFSRRPEWESAIGRLMMAGAYLEMNVLTMITLYGGAELGKVASGKTHFSRLEILEGLSADAERSVRHSVRKLVDSLRAFTRQRNHVAHNPLIYALDSRSDESHRFGAIVDRADPKRRIGLEEIAELAERGEKLSNGFYFAWMLIMGDPKHVGKKGPE
jgi:hypothetical protein